MEGKISNQLFLYCQLFLLLSNNFACSMQSQQLALRRNEQEEAEKIIKGFPEVAMFIYLMATKNPITRLSGLQCENLFYTKHQESWNLLLEGPPRNGKRTLAKNIAKYLKMEYTLMRLKDIIPRYSHTHQVDLLADEILPYLSQENSQHVFIIKDINLLQAFHSSDEDGNKIVHDAERHLQRYIQEAERKNKENKRNNLIFLATTKTKLNNDSKIQSLFMPIKIGNLDHERRTAILINLLKLNKNIDPQSCISDQRFIKNFVNKIYEFSIGDLKEVAKTALNFASIRHSRSKQTEPLQKRDLEHALIAVYPSTKMGITG